MDIPNLCRADMTRHLSSEMQYLEWSALQGLKQLGRRD